jgi:hypothetical protein
MLWDANVFNHPLITARAEPCTSCTTYLTGIERFPDMTALLTDFPFK